MGSLITKIPLEADCDKCAALCCVGFAFEKSAQFAIDKGAGEPCPNLDRRGRCAVHGVLGPLGFNGCVRYTCFGAGQHVTQKLFGGRSWQDDAGLTRPMLQSFFVMTRLHELLVLLQEVSKLDLPEEKIAVAAQYFERLDAYGSQGVAGLEAFEQSRLEPEIRRFLKSLSAEMILPPEA